MRARGFDHEARRIRGWQGSQRRQRRPKVVCGEAQLAGVARQPFMVVYRMSDGMRPGRQLGEQEKGNEKESVQPIHGAILTPIIQKPRFPTSSALNSRRFGGPPSFTCAAVMLNDERNLKQADSKIGN